MRAFCCFLVIAVLVVLSTCQDGSTKEENEVTSGDCKCVPYYQCANGSVIEDGATLIDVRIGEEGCQDYLDVCCKTPPLETDSEAEAEAGAGEGETSDGICGVRQPKGVAFRITGATDGEAQFGEFPWMAAILLSVEAAEHEIDRSADALKIKHVLLYLCGGALIHPSVVLTGAHCVHSHTNSTIIARVGEWDSQTNKEIYRHQDREVSEAVIHPFFKRSNLFNDVALLFLSEPVKPAKHIGFICLPQKGQVAPHATRCLASGWGKDAFGKEGTYKSILKSLDLPVVGREICERNFRKTRLGRFFKLHESFMCAGGEKGKDTCKGDGGSPLMCPHPKNPERLMQSGIVAWGIGCQEQEVPGAYVNVALFREWIDEKMKEHNLDTSYYTL